MFYLGVDQHHKQITICLKDKNGNVIRRRQVSRQDSTLLPTTQRTGWIHGIHEFCGFNDRLIETLRQSNCREIVLIHPERRSKHKTDPRDTAKLAEMLWINGKRLAGGLKPRNSATNSDGGRARFARRPQSEHRCGDPFPVNYPQR